MELIFWRIGDAEIDVEEAPVGSMGEVGYLQKELEEFLLEVADQLRAMVDKGRDEFAFVRYDAR